MPTSDNNHMKNSPLGGLGGRMTLRRELRSFVQQKSLCPPVSLKQLEELAVEFATQKGDCGDILPWLMVEINNQLWVDIIASIPHNRRLLMLPKCLSKHGECQGEYDEFGLLCHKCGRCLIPDLQDKAEQLGTLSLVAEGFTQVIELIENHVVDAVIGVSCLDSLEKAFPLLVSHAVPGLAIPLNDSGCINTHVDEGYVAELLSIQHPSPNTYHLLHYEDTRQQIDRWFSREELECVFQHPKDKTSQVCLDWMTRGGRRWRPYLLSAVYQSITGDSMLNEDVHRAAIAVECFHKASLIHDDIEDKDMMRYDLPTVNALYGDAFAINVGDALLGMGYRLLAQSNNLELVRLIADAHVSLCKGQGLELEESIKYKVESGKSNGKENCQFSIVNFQLSKTLDIMRHKTVPAFEVSLLLGLACTGNHQHLRPMLHNYSEALGIAYQLKDDMEDVSQDGGKWKVDSGKWKVDSGKREKSIFNFQLHNAVFALRNEHPEWDDDAVKGELKGMIEQYKQQALDALNDLDCLELKRLLYQVTEKILK